MYTEQKYDRMKADTDCYSFVNVYTKEEAEYLASRCVIDDYGTNAAFERDDAGQFIEDNDFVFMLTFHIAGEEDKQVIATSFSIGDIIDDLGYGNLDEHITFVGIGSTFKKYQKEMLGVAEI